MLRSSVVYLAGRMVAALITLLSVAIYTRLLSPTEYGIYALVFSGATMAYASLLQWLATSLGRFWAAYPDPRATLLSHVAAGYAIVVLPVVVVAALAIPPLAPALEWPILALGIVMFISLSLAEIDLVVLQMSERPGLYVQFTVLRVALAAAIGIPLAWLGWGSVGILIGLLVGNLAIILPHLWRIWRPVRWSLLDRRLFRQIVAYGVPFAATGALAALIHASDRYIIGALLGADQVGLYSAPYDLAMRSLRMLMMVVAMAGQPVIFRVFEKQGRDAALPLIRRQSELVAGVALPAGIGFILLSPAIADLAFGNAFETAGRELMPWVATATILGGCQTFFLALAFVLPKQPLRQIYVFGIGALANIVLNFLLIPSFGLLGAAYATLAAYGLIAVGSFLIGRQLFDLPLPTRGLTKILLASAAWALILWPIRGTTALLPVVLHTAVGIVVYFAIFCCLDIGQTRRPAERVLRRGLGYVGLGRSAR